MQIKGYLLTTKKCKRLYKVFYKKKKKKEKENTSMKERFQNDKPRPYLHTINVFFF